MTIIYKNEVGTGTTGQHESHETRQAVRRALPRGGSAGPPAPRCRTRSAWRPQIRIGECPRPPAPLLFKSFSQSSRLPLLVLPSPPHTHLTLTPRARAHRSRRRKAHLVGEELFNIFISIFSTFYVSNFNICLLQFQHFES